jgi:hypothetical protein
MNRTISRRVLGGAIAVATLGLGAFVTTQTLAGAPAPRSDDNVIRYYTASATTPTVVSGRDVAVGITLTNVATSGSINAANITVPPTLLSYAAPTNLNITASAAQPVGATIALVSGSLQLRGLAVAKNASVTANATLRIPCDANASSYVFTSDVRTSSNFAATTNKFTLKTGTTYATTISTGPCTIAWTGQPANAEKAQVITQSVSNPAGSPLEVTVKDGAGSPVAWWTSPISLAATANGLDYYGVSHANAVTGTAQIADVTPVNGVAHFAPSIATVATAYQLVANTSYTPLSGSAINASTTSASFDVGRFVANVTCVAGFQCSTGDVTSANGDQTANVVIPPGGTFAPTVTAKYLDPALGYVLDCSDKGYTATSDVLSATTISVTGAVSGTKTITLSKAVAVNGSVDPLDYQVCFAAPYDFPSVNLNTLAKDFTNHSNFMGNTSPQALPDNTPGFRGLLLSCSWTELVPAPDQPCVASRSVSAGTVTVSIRVKAADPSVRF